MAYTTVLRVHREAYGAYTTVLRVHREAYGGYIPSWYTQGGIWWVYTPPGTHTGRHMVGIYTLRYTHREAYPGIYTLRLAGRHIHHYAL